ncbi:AraC family transcriptional regulator [Bifidobacterium moukalabense]|uniref:AraC family transcriptional regulator n=1 Tax=Bifidobacterium moukalabense TaxID=1333651 RepID=UPI0010F592FF|nr:AraC family transcriptional regulator [Bifidobacterium moukalabense]
MSEDFQPITVFSDLSEQVHYNLPGLPLYAHRDPMSRYRDFRCSRHWHRDLEFLHVITGEISYFINGRIVALRAGEGIMVNSSRLHYTFCPDRRESWFTCVVAGPALFERLSPDIARRVERRTAQNMDDYITLTNETAWQRKALQSIDDIVALMPNATDASPLQAVAQAIALCDTALEHFHLVDDAGTPEYAYEQRNRFAVLAMTGLIQQRFSDPLTLDDIASAASISRSQCCMLFRKYVGSTPNEYLIEQRIEHARALLAETGMGINEIAKACGFSSPSYFTNVFRRRCGATPRAFRTMQRDDTTSGNPLSPHTDRYDDYGMSRDLPSGGVASHHVEDGCAAKQGHDATGNDGKDAFAA